MGALAKSEQMVQRSEKLSQNADQFINWLFDELAGTFPAWKSAFESQQAITTAKRIWFETLSENKIKRSEIQTGLRQARKSIPFGVTRVCVKLCPCSAVAFVEQYVEVGTTKSLRETAKILKMPEKRMIECLIRDKYLFRQSGNLLPYQSVHAKDLFAVKTGTAEHGHNFTQTRVTPKGIEFIASRYATELMQ